MQVRGTPRTPPAPSSKEGVKTGYWADSQPERVESLSSSKEGVKTGHWADSQPERVESLSSSKEWGRQGIWLFLRSKMVNLAFFLLIFLILNSCQLPNTS